MKTFKHLYPSITSFDNLWLAFKGAARGIQQNCRAVFRFLVMLAMDCKSIAPDAGFTIRREQLKSQQHFCVILVVRGKLTGR